MSIPNLLAISRLILTPIAMALILVGPNDQGTRIFATVVFVIAALTDFADAKLSADFHCCLRPPCISKTK